MSLPFLLFKFHFLPGELKRLRKMYGLKEPAKKSLEASKKLKKLKLKKTNQSDAKIKKVHH
jgi:hypothetical protein